MDLHKTGNLFNLIENLMKAKFNIHNLIDFNELNQLLEGFKKSTGIETAIADLNGIVLSKSGGKEFYTQYHSINPFDSNNTLISNIVFPTEHGSEEKYHFFKCSNGLVAVAIPISINGEPFANLFAGQFFMEEPNWGHFKEQAMEYGYDEQKYRNAIAQLPVVSEEKVRNALDILINMIESYIASAWQKSDNLTTDFGETDETLIAIQENYRILFETLPLGVIHQNAAGEIISANPASQEILGITMDQMRGKTSMDTRWKMIHEDGSEVPGSEHPSMIALSTREKVGPVIRGVFIPERHEYVWLSITAIPLCRPGESTPYQSYSIFQDITLTKKSEQLIEEHRQLLETVVHHLPVAINVLSGDDFRIELANPVYRAIAPGKEMTGLTWEELWPETGQEFAQICRRVIETGEPFKVLNQHNTIRRTPDGPIEDTYFSWELHRIKLPGDKGWGLLGSTWETTELVKANIRLKKVLDAENVGVMFWNIETGILVDANETFLEMMGYSRSDIEERCFTWQKFTPEEYHDISLNEIEKFKSVGRVGPYEKEYYCKDGSRKWFLFAGSSLGGNECVEFCVDISDRKIIEKELEQKQILINEMGKAARVGGWEFDVESGKGTWTEETARIHDLDPYDSTNVDIGLSFYKPESKVILKKAIKKAIENKEPYDLELEIVSAIGTEKWVHTIGKPVIEDGKVVKMRGSFQDITERKKAEISLSESETRYRSLFENMNAGFVLFEAVTKKNNQGDLIILAANSQFEKTTGLVTKDVIGQPLSQVLPGIEKDKADWIGKYSKVAFTGKPESFEQGSELLGYYYSISVFQAGPNQCAVTFIDITERKRNEIKLRESYDLIRIAGEKAKLGGWVVLVDENLMYWSDEVAAIHETPLGYSPQVEEGIKFYAPEWRDKIIEVYGKCLQDGIPYDEEMEIITATGKRIWVRTIGEAIRNESGKIYKIQGAFQDITLKKIAEEELRKSKHDLEDFFENDISANYVVSTSGEILNCNKTFLTLFGFKSKADVIGFDITSLFRYPNKRFIMLNKVREQGKVENYEVEFVSADGKVIYAMINAIGIFDKNQQLEKIRGYVIDITNKILAEEELRKHEQLLSSVMDTQQELICRFLPDTTLTFVNKAYCNIFGKTESELIGRKFLEVVPESDWDDITSKLNSFNKKNPKITFESHAIKADGSIILIEWTDVAIFNEEGKIVEFQSVGRDVTEQKQTAKELLFLSNLNEILRKIAVDYLNLPVSEVNTFITKSLGEIGKFIKADRVYIYDYNWQLHTSSNTYEWCEDEIEPQIENLQDVSLNDVPHWWNTHKQGLPLIIEDVIALDESDVVRQILEPQGVKSLITIPIMDNGHCLGFVGLDYVQDYHNPSKREKDVLFVFADVLINIRKRTESNMDLLKAKEKAEESDKLKTAFINNISHEIRTPLNGILGFGQIISESELSKEKRSEFFKILEKSSTRLMNTVDDYMDMAILVSNTMEVNKTKFALESVLVTLAEKMKNLCSDKKLELKLEAPIEFGDVTVNSDPELIKKIIEKLVDNAIKFTNEGSITLGYCENPNNIEIFVNDTGIGIEDDKLDLIFEMFKQADVSMTRGHEGSGLGLTIARGMASLLGGTLNVTSKMGAGSTFTLTLPIEVENKVGLEDILLTTSQKGMKEPLILIAEDDDLNFLYLEVLLNELNYKHIHAVNGNEAVDFCRKNADISLILMDIKMPVMTGDEATRQIREFRPELPIIATTAYAQTGDGHRFLEAGCNDYLPKPITKEKLEAIIRKYIS